MFKVLRHETVPGLYGVIEQGVLGYSHMPQLFPVTTEQRHLELLIDIVKVNPLEGYKLITVELKEI